MNRFAILEDNLENARKLVNYILKNNKRVRLVNLAVNVEEIMENKGELGKGDILIVDLEHTNGKGLLEIINSYKQLGKFMPYIIVIGDNLQTYESLEEYLPYIYISIPKPFSLKTIAQVIEQITYETSTHCYEKMVKKELHTFDLNPATKGYAYIVEAITLSLDDETLLSDMSKGVYKMVAIQNDISVNNVKWAIEKTLKSIIRYTSSNIIEKYFYVVEGEKVTPKTFISTIVENLKIKLEQEVEEYA